MTDLTRVPFRTPSGAMQWQDFAAWFETWQREIAAKLDARNPNSDLSPSLVVAADGSATIKSAARLASQKTLPIVNAGNRLSAQNINPLSSTGTATTAAIQIAAHTVQYGFGVVAYGSGTISGLTPLTTYFIYASDPNYAGGAVAYTATTTAPTVVSNPGYYYVGSIKTANSTPTGTVVAASSTNPITIQTATAHGFTSGNTVTFSAMPGDFAAINSTLYTITVVDADEFTVPVDGSLFAAYTSGGVVTRVSIPTGGFVNGGGWNWQGDIP